MSNFGIADIIKALKSLRRIDGEFEVEGKAYEFKAYRMDAQRIIRIDAKEKESRNDG